MSSRDTQKAGLVRRSERGAWPIRLLIWRLYATIGGDRANVILFVVQPVVIAMLIGLVATDERSIPEKLFLGGIASLWLGCSNAAQSIVRERPVFVRERLAGLRIHSYLISKFVGMGFITSLQVVIIYSILALTGTGLVGHAGLQLFGLLGGALVLTSVGIMVSAWSRSITHAILAVPMIIIPQILFCGYVFPLETWSERPVPMAVSRVSPSYATQKLIDLSFFWNRELDYDYLDTYELEAPNLQNLRVALIPTKTWLTQDESEYTISIAQQSQYYATVSDARPLSEQVVNPKRSYPKYFIGSGHVFAHRAAAQFPMLSFMVWIIASYLGAWRGLCKAT